MSDDLSEIKQEEQPIVEQQPEVVEQPQEQIEEASEEPKQESKVTPKKNNAEYNFEELRRQREADRRRAEEAERRANELFELLKAQKGAQNQEQRDAIEDELAKLAKDDLATVDHIDKKLYKYNKTAKKEVDILRNEVETLKAKLEEQNFRAKFPDLDEVLSPDNIELLKREDPELADTISKMPAGSKEQVTLAYKYIKRILPKPESKQTPSQSIPEEKRKALENAKKPVSIQAISKQSAIGNAHIFENGLTPELKKQLWSEMQDAMKRG